ncbi:hypothetical protein D9M68_877820 [compost metagenome]
MLGGDQRAAGGLPVAAEGGQNPVAPFAAGYESHSSTHAIVPGAVGHFTCLVLSRQAELEQLRGTFLIAVAVVQGQGGDRQLLLVAQLLHQRFLQRSDDQLHAIGLRLAIELVQRVQSAAVVQFDGR